MASNTIVLKGKGHHDEAVTYEAISPGMGAELYLDTTLKLAKPQGTQAETLKAGISIVKEDALQGKTVDNAYAAGETGFYYTPLPGDHINILIKSGEAVALGDVFVIEAGGSGLFVEAAGTETKYQFKALEAAGTLAANTLVEAVCI
jgi:hypothetical protein